MPTKYKMGEVVAVSYNTRTQYFKFIGKIIDYADKKYHILFLCEGLEEPSSWRRNGYTFKCDMVFKCWVYEIQCVYNEPLFFDEILPNKARLKFSSFCKSILDSSSWYTKESTNAKATFQSFKTKRILDNALDRLFPVIQYAERGEYLYDW